MAENLDKYYTELDQQLQQLALVDWPTFVKLVGEDAVLSAKICLLKTRGRSQAQISTKLKVSLRKAQYNAEKCKC